jgi:hypothetical protein
MNFKNTMKIDVARTSYLVTGCPILDLDSR